MNKIPYLNNFHGGTNMNKTVTGEKQGSFVRFNSSDKGMDEFINDYLDKHLRHNKNQIHGLPLGASVMFNKEWETMSLLWFDTTKRNISDDRFEMVKSWLEEVPIDKFGYVWSNKYGQQPPTDGPLKYFSQGWPFPDYAQSEGQSQGWEFNKKSAQGWTTNGDASVNFGYLSVDYVGNRCELESPDIDVDSFHCPFLEIDITINGKMNSKIKEIFVYWTTKDEPQYSEDKSFKQSVDSSIPFETIPSKWSRHIFIPAYLNKNWKDHNITKLKIIIEGYEKVNIKLDLNFVRMNYDTRHVNNNALLLTSMKNYFEWTGDITFLKNNINRARKAMKFMLDHMKGQEGLIDQSYFTGHDGTRGLGHGLGNGYWDILALPSVDLYSNIYFYRAVKAMEYLERMAESYQIDLEKPTVVSPNAMGTDKYESTSESLKALLRVIKDKFQKTFWSEKNGRFFAGVNPEGEVIDYGFIMFNVEAVASGLCTKEQSEAIMKWINGDRIVDGDLSMGKDIYKFAFAPRSTTFKNDKHYFWAWHGETVKYGEQVQDGGAIIYYSYYDLVSRINVFGPDNAFTRFKDIQKWYEEVKTAGGTGDQFYRKYYNEKGIQMQGGGTAGGVGLDFEFLESALLYSSIPLGFFGLKSEKPDTLQIAPNLPAALDFWQIENLMYHDVLLDIKIGRDYIEISNVRGNVADLTFEITLPKPKSSFLVKCDGNKLDSWCEEGNNIIITAPMIDGKFEVK